jgi:hypothetical protein
VLIYVYRWQHSVLCESSSRRCVRVSSRNGRFSVMSIAGSPWYGEEMGMSSIFFLDKGNIKGMSSIKYICGKRSTLYRAGVVSIYIGYSCIMFTKGYRYRSYIYIV